MSSQSTVIIVRGLGPLFFDGYTPSMIAEKLRDDSDFIELTLGVPDTVTIRKEHISVTGPALLLAAPAPEQLPKGQRLQ